MDIQGALEYLAGLERRGIHLDLRPVSSLLAAIGDPQRTYRTIHVAGTNGKGSVAAMIASMLHRAGYTVGLYTSPHLVDFRERIRINGTMIPEEDLACLVEYLGGYMAGEITFFEFTTALAFLYFQRRSVEIAVIEVGMGGRLDATNCIIPEVSLITNISREHEQYLGRRISEIAAEKGGIIKEGVTCITGTVQRKALAVLEAIAHERRTRLIKAGRDFTLRSAGGSYFSYHGMNRTVKGLTVPLAGRHQLKNASLALAAVEILTIKGMPVDDRAIVEGMAATRWEGRLEVIDRNPLVVADGAHNSAGVSALCRSLREEFTYGRLIVIFGVMADKRYRSMLSRLAFVADIIILTEPAGDRALRVTGREDWLPPMAEGMLQVVPRPEEALLRARSLARRDDLILITGSLYLVGEIKRLTPPV